MKTIELASRNATRTLFGYSDKRSAYPADIAGTGLGKEIVVAGVVLWRLSDLPAYLA
jgi:hypothetical protein